MEIVSREVIDQLRITRYLCQALAGFLTYAIIYSHQSDIIGTLLVNTELSWWTSGTHSVF